MPNLFYRNASWQTNGICPPEHLDQKLKACPQKRRDWVLYSPCSYCDILDTKLTESLLCDFSEVDKGHHNTLTNRLTWDRERDGKDRWIRSLQDWCKMCVEAVPDLAAWRWLCLSPFIFLLFLSFLFPPRQTRKKKATAYWKTHGINVGLWWQGLW